MAQAVLPGQSGILHRGRFVDWVKQIGKREEIRLSRVMQDIGEDTVVWLREVTPKDTGAAAGTTVGARRPIYKAHPGYRLRIGNAPGDTGWQLKSTNNSRRFAIFTPMWEAYLKKVNYEGDHGNFVEEAARHMKSEIQRRLG